MRGAIPVLLTKIDAMLYAAERLESEVKGLEMVAVLQGLLKDLPAELVEGQAKESFAWFKAAASGIVDLELQKAALRSAAKEIRASAMEAKLADARAAARVDRIVP